MAEIADFLGTGGPIILLLVVLSLLSLSLIVIKISDLWNSTSGGDLRATSVKAYETSGAEEAAKILNSGKSPADRILAFAMSPQARALSTDVRESEIARRGNQEISRMNRFLRILEVIAMISPLLGLLGTVLGMIQSFQQLELAEGAANAAVLAGGIWQALLTTAAGLLVAIPAAVAANLLAARVEIATYNIEDGVAQFLTASDNSTSIAER